MNDKDKLKQKVNELLDMSTADMRVYIGIEDFDLTVEFYSPDSTIRIAREIDLDSFYTSVEEMLQEFKDTIRIHRERMARRDRT